jgi:hypothetical protein
MSSQQMDKRDLGSARNEKKKSYMHLPDSRINGVGERICNFTWAAPYLYIE